MCFFIGNDFIHNSPCINIRYKGLNNLLDVYNKLQEENGGLFYLIYNNKLDLNNFKKFINKLSLKENELLENIMFIRSKQEYKFKNMFQDIYQSYINKESLDIYQEDRLEEFHNHIPIIDRRDELKIFNNLDSWQRRYYMFNLYHKHNYNPSYDDLLKQDINDICKNYLESFVWTANYYFDDYKINLDADFIKNLTIMLNLYKKNKELIFIDMILFLTNNYLNNAKTKNLFSNDKIIESKNFIFKNINKFYLYNLNQNSLLNSINYKINNE
jgi:5'-3' exonuclease